MEEFKLTALFLINNCFLYKICVDDFRDIALAISFLIRLNPLGYLWCCIPMRRLILEEIPLLR